MGDIHYKQKEYQKALDFHNKSLSIYKALKDEHGIAEEYKNISNNYFEMKRNSKAISYCKKALLIAQKINALPLINNCSENLYKFYKESGDFDNSLNMHELLLATKDSLAAMSATEIINNLKQEEKYNLLRQADSIKNANKILLHEAEIKIQKEENRRERAINLTLLISVLLISIFTVIVYVNYQKTKNQKKTISLQHIELDESHKELNQTHKEIKDSINYAKKIQDALLTSNNYIKKILPTSFVFYKPKDIVSGDFYWAHKSKKGKIFFTVSDCTGHGVPGALMSMIGNSLLNENIIENNIEDPSEILNNMRNKITKLLNQEGVDNESKDGMHMALCSLDTKSNTLEYAGAFNPLIHISNGELKELKADSQPIALYSGEVKPFTKHTIKLKSGDTIYLYSDGFQDQFGGEKNKKYMTKRFKNFLFEVSKLPIENQYQSIDKEFKNWKGNEEQVDDVCIMGVKV
ncbi:MAG: SpoIIE family protein phosphatase [Flavobacteriales bacterium]|nr:SpoIIE family protein phosphatase [Flavobacteriales bacterium]